MSKTKFFPAGKRPFYRIDVNDVEYVTFARDQKQADKKFDKAGAGDAMSYGRQEAPQIDAGGDVSFAFLTNDTELPHQEIVVTAKNLDQAIRAVGKKFQSAKKFRITKHATRFVR